MNLLVVSLGVVPANTSPSLFPETEASPRATGSVMVKTSRQRSRTAGEGTVPFPARRLQMGAGAVTAVKLSHARTNADTHMHTGTCVRELMTPGQRGTLLGSALQPKRCDHIFVF